MELKLTDVTKTFGEITALNHVSVTFTPGIYGILGPNGAGKSTMIHLITDNIARGDGEITYDGREIIKEGKNYRRKVGYMPQEQGFYASMSARAFLMYMADVKQIPRKQQAEEVSRLLEAVNLRDVADRRVGGFSGGMRQRVMLAQALLGDPEILILDEPTAGLDPMERISLRKFVSELSKNRIVLWTTHVVSDIETIADQILILKKGTVVAFDTTDKLLQTVRTAEPTKTISLEDVFLYYMQI